MATTVNYAKKCPDCDGEPIRILENSGKVFLGIFKGPDQLIACERCNGSGFIKPKKVVLHPDRFEPTVIY